MHFFSFSGPHSKIFDSEPENDDFHPKAIGPTHGLSGIQKFWWILAWGPQWPISLVGVILWQRHRSPHVVFIPNGLFWFEGDSSMTYKQTGLDSSIFLHPNNWEPRGVLTKKMVIWKKSTWWRRWPRLNSFSDRMFLGASFWLDS